MNRIGFAAYPVNERADFVKHKLMNWAVTCLALLGIGVAGAVRIAGRQNSAERANQVRHDEELKREIRDSISRSVDVKLKDFSSFSPKQEADSAQNQDQ